MYGKQEGSWRSFCLLKMRILVITLVVSMALVTSPMRPGYFSDSAYKLGFGGS
jgi:hypothetical protein